MGTHQASSHRVARWAYQSETLLDDAGKARQQTGRQDEGAKTVAARGSSRLLYGDGDRGQSNQGSTWRTDRKVGRFTCRGAAWLAANLPRRRVRDPLYAAALTGRGYSRGIYCDENASQDVDIPLVLGFPERFRQTKNTLHFLIKHISYNVFTTPDVLRRTPPSWALACFRKCLHC